MIVESLCRWMEKVEEYEDSGDLSETLDFENIRRRKRRLHLVISHICTCRSIYTVTYNSLFGDVIFGSDYYFIIWGCNSPFMQCQMMTY